MWAAAFCLNDAKIFRNSHLVLELHFFSENLQGYFKNYFSFMGKKLLMIENPESIQTDFWGSNTWTPYLSL